MGQESLSQAVKEGGLVSIRDNEAEGGVSAYPRTICQFFCLFLVSCQLLSVCPPAPTHSVEKYLFLSL